MIPVALLIPLLTSLLPGALPAIGRLIAGDRGAGVGQSAAHAVEAVLREVTGASDESGIRAALADPEKAGQVLLQLNTLAAQREKQQLEAKLDVIRLENASQTGARDHTMDLVKQSSPLAWGAAVISFVVIACYAMVSFYSMTVVIPAGSEQIVIGLHESLKSLAAIVVGYWVGSSRGSSQKDEDRRVMAEALRSATSVNSDQARTIADNPQTPRPVRPVGSPNESAEDLNVRLGGELR